MLLTSEPQGSPLLKKTSGWREKPTWIGNLCHRSGDQRQTLSMKQQVLCLHGGACCLTTSPHPSHSPWQMHCPVIFPSGPGCHLLVLMWERLALQVLWPSRVHQALLDVSWSGAFFILSQHHLSYSVPCETDTRRICSHVIVESETRGNWAFPAQGGPPVACGALEQCLLAAMD